MYRKHYTDYRDIKWILTWHYWAAFVTTRQRLHSLNVIHKQMPKWQQSWACHSEKLSKSTYLMQRQHQERSATASIYNYCNKSGVYCTKGAIPSNTGNADVVVTLIIFHRLAKHVPKFALSYHSPHCVCREEERQKKEISYRCRDLLLAQKMPAKDLHGTGPSRLHHHPASSNTEIQFHSLFLHLALDLLSSQPVLPFVLIFNKVSGCLAPNTTELHFQGCFTERICRLNISFPILNVFSYCGKGSS